VPNLIVSAVSTFDNKGLKKGKKEISTFEKQIKSFAKVFAAAFSVTALSKYSKAAVKAFMEDEKAAKSLEQQLKNTGYQFSGPAVEMYIANLQKTTGVLDDDLRPAFQQLLTVTGSLTTSQDALNTALNISAGTGKSLSAVTAALSRGYAGNTTGLSRLGAGLSKTLLKTNDMNLIMGELNKKFAGQSAARLTTYAGKMDLLTAAAANAQEIIGKSLLDSLSALGDDNSIEGLTKNMEDFATATGDVIYGLGIVAKRIKELTTIPGLGSLFDVKNIPVIGAYLGGFQQIGKNAREANNSQFNTVGRPSPAEIATQLKLLKGKKEELGILNKKNALENKNVEELKKKFDLERIGINAALNNATDEETKLRLKSQLAILDNNEALAKKYLAELEATEALRKLAEQAKLAGMSLEDFALFKVKTLNTKIDDYLQNTALEMVRALNAQIAAFIASLGGVKTPTSTAAPTYAYALSTAQATNEKIAAFENKVAMESTQDLNSRINQFLSQNAQRTTAQAPMDIRLTIDGGSDKLSQAIAESIQVATRSGYSTVPNGFIV
jgi:uncharacterized protein with GYD domain